MHHVQGLAYQLAGKGIRANSVSPGNTCLRRRRLGQHQAGNPELCASALGLNPTGRMGTPQEMARAIVFVASPASSFTSGTNLRCRRSADPGCAVLIRAQWTVADALCPAGA